MVLGLITAAASIGGAIIGAKSNKANNKRNAKAVAKANSRSRTNALADARYNRLLTFDQRRYDEIQAKKAFDRNAASVRNARSYDRSQVVDQRNYDRQQALDAESRGRSYLADDRRYNSPAETRRRLEDAGYNPLTMVDPSNAVTGSGAFVSGQTSIASSDIAQATAAQSGYSSISTPATIAAQSTSYDWAPSIAAAGQAYSSELARQEEMALRSTQIDMENQRLNAVIQRASLSPIVPGPYGPRNRGSNAPNVTTSTQTFSPTDQIADPGLAVRTFGDSRPSKLEPVIDVPVGADVELPSGAKIPALNPDLDLEGPAAWLNGVWISGMTAADTLQTAGDYVGRKARDWIDRSHVQPAGVPIRPQRNLDGDIDGPSLLDPFGLQTVQ